jgi:U4/U6 small nuclear ribonucleoprotein PRP31
MSISIASRLQILAFVESQMSALAPNLSALVGTRPAAQLMGLAGDYLLVQFTRTC